MTKYVRGSATLILTLIVCICMSGCAANTGNTTATETASSPKLEIATSGALSGEVPIACEHHAGKLQNGVLPNVEQDQGHVSMTSDSIESAKADGTTGRLVIGTDRRYAVAATITCDRGGVDWPDLVVVWNERFQIAGYVDLRSADNSKRGHVTALELDGSSLLIKWVGGADVDPGCCGMTSFLVQVDLYHTSNTEVELGNTNGVRGEDQIKELVNAAEEDGAERPEFVSEQAWESVRNLVDHQVSIDPAILQCPGGAMGGGKYRGIEMPNLGKEISCWISLGPSKYLGFSVSFMEWGSYSIDTAYVTEKRVGHVG